MFEDIFICINFILKNKKKDHKNYAGEVEGIGPVFISVLKDKQKGHTRALIRVPQQTFHLCVEHTAASSSKSLKAILAKHNQKINQKSLKCIKSPDLVKELEKFDNSHVRFFSILFKYFFAIKSIFISTIIMILLITMIIIIIIMLIV